MFYMYVLVYICSYNKVIKCNNNLVGEYLQYQSIYKKIAYRSRTTYKDCTRAIGICIESI